MHDDTDGWQRTLRLMAVAVSLYAGTAQASAGCTFFVRAGFMPASGPANGSSPESAFATIKDGANAMSNPGDVLCVGPGLYVEGNIGVGIDGLPGTRGDGGSPVELRADATGQSTHDAPGAVQIVPPPNDPVTTTAFLIFGRHDVLIDGFTLSGFGDAGIQARADISGTSSTGITIRNNVITGCRNGIDVIARDGIVIDHNTTIGNEHNGIAVEACLFADGFGRCRDLSGAPVSPVVSGNRVGGNGAQGISIQVSDNAVIKHNVIYANGDKGIVLEGSTDPLVANNLVYANGQQGLAIGKTAASPNAVVVNNTLYGNGSWGVDIGNATAGSPGGSVVNNVIWGNKGGDGFGGVGVLNEDSGATPVRPASVCRYLAGFNVIEATAYGPHTPNNAYDLHADPQLVDPAGPDGVLGGENPGANFVDRSADDDFHVRQSGSPAVDSGSARVAEIGLDGSTASDGQPDQGIVDVGFHYGATAERTITLPTPYMPLYVRVTGADTGNGFGPGSAFATIGAAAARAQAGITVVVGPGRYPECNLKPRAHTGLAAFVADPTGEQTTDAAGAVLVDASQCRLDQTTGALMPGQAGFNISSECGVIVDGFHITGAIEDGIRIDDHSDGAVVRNNVTFHSLNMRGIHITNSDDVRISNNLTYANSAGIHLGGVVRTTDPSPPGCRRARIEFNTALNSEFNGIQVGDGIGDSSLAMLRYNVTAGNGKNGVEVGDNTTRAVNLRGFVNAYNFIGDRYATGIARGEGDLLLDSTVEPLYLDPSAVDVSGDWTQDGHFRLVQTAAGQATQSRAVDGGADITATDAGMGERSTRSDGVGDTGKVDLGYHYPRHGILAGDCDGDGTVRINELVLAVNIALGAAPMSECRAVDTNGDGQAEINELVRAVSNGLR